jgi:GAF domain-containing protein
MRRATPRLADSGDVGDSGDTPTLAPAGVFAELARSLAEASGLLPTLQDVIGHALVVVPCDWAAVAAVDEIGPRPARMSASNDPALMETVARISAESTSSPGREAFRTASMVSSPDLSSETRFGDYPRAMVDQTPIRSVLSFGLQLRQERLGVLSVYSRAVNAFDDQAVERASLLADHVAIAIEAETSANRAESMSAGLQSNRVIGVALGILMERHQLTPDEAFAMLRRASSYQNRKLALIAEDLVTTGHLPTE